MILQAVQQQLAFGDVGLVPTSRVVCAGGFGAVTWFPTEMCKCVRFQQFDIYGLHSESIGDVDGVSSRAFGSSTYGLGFGRSLFILVDTDWVVRASSEERFIGIDSLN